MNLDPIRRALRSLLPGTASERRLLTVQHLGFGASELEQMPGLLDGVGRELGLQLMLDGVSGDLVLAEHDFISRVSPQVLNAFLEERPLIVISRSGIDTAGDARRHARSLHAELVQQLRHLAAGDVAMPAPAVAAAPSSGYESDFDSTLQAERLQQLELDPDRARLLNLLRRGLLDPSAPAVQAGFGRGAALRLDFAAGTALVDPLADQRLRVTREVPYLNLGEGPGPSALVRELDLVVWDVAVAAGGFRLLHSPVNWWHTELIALPGAEVSRFSRMPQHLELWRALSAGPQSPAELRRRCRVGLGDLRAFLQACLFVGLVHWLPVGRV